MSEKEQNVEELLAELFTENINDANVEIKQENEDEEDNNVKYVFTEEEIPNEVLTYLTSREVENFTEVEDVDFENLFRMTKNTFFDLQTEIQDSGSDSYDNNLLLSLWILGNTAPFNEVSDIIGVEENYVKLICEKYFRKIMNLSSKYISWPEPSEMLCLEYIFNAEYEFPSIIGALGCLHIAVQLSENITNCSEYFNTNSGNYTVILQAVCDSNLLFRDIFLGYPGSNSVQDILKASPLYIKLMDEDDFLRKTNKHLLGGTEHPQLETLLTPYPVEEDEELSNEQLKFNSLHSSAMLVLDKTFYIIENRFQRMKCLDSVNIEFTILAVGAICVLHNFTRVRGDHLSL